jgi:hypothetical protein
MDRTVLYTDKAHTAEVDEFVRFTVDGETVEGRVVKVEDEATFTLWIENEGEFCEPTPYTIDPFFSIEFLGYGE